MDHQQILNKTITIQGVGQKQTKNGTKYSLKDHEGRTFNFFTTKQDGSDTAAFAQFKNMNLQVGSTVMIGYVEDEFEMEGKKVISKKIINFRETNDVPSQTPSQVKSSNPGHSVSSQGTSNDAYGRRLALHGMVNARLVNHDIVKVLSELGELLRLENLIDEKLNEVRPAFLEDANLDLPVIQQEDLDVEDIPW